MMKSLWLAIAVPITLLLSIQNASSQNNFYTIYIGTFVNAESSDFDKLRDIGFIYAEDYDNSLKKIYLGGFTSREKAEKILPSLQNKGYVDAFISRKIANEANQVAVIQIGMEPSKGSINWSRYAQAGPLYVNIINDQMKIVTGLYRNLQEAKELLPNVQNSGFSDAFVKTVSRDRLIRLSEFETRGVRPSKQAGIVNRSDGYSNNTELREYADTESRIENFRGTTEYGETGGRILVNDNQRSDLSKPSVRSSVKRTSAIELQKVLKSVNAYKSSLDGLYGSGTRKAYDSYTSNSWEWRKYALIANQLPPPQPGDASSQLEAAIQNIISNPRGSRIDLESSREPIAQAYVAYMMFMNNESRILIDELMNTALRNAYKSPLARSRAPIDTRMTYSYQSLSQLLLHLRYIHAADPAGPSVPCWLFDLHPKEAGEAFNTSYGADFTIQGCDGFLSWEELKILQTLATELNPTGISGVNNRELIENQNRRIGLFLAPQLLNAREASTIELWNDRLWKVLEAWGARDPLHQKILTPFKVSFYQSQVLLEDYYMNKGIKYQDAKFLSLYTINTIIQPYLKNYL